MRALPFIGQTASSANDAVQISLHLSLFMLKLGAGSAPNLYERFIF